MKTKKLLAAFLSAAMVITTAAIPALAENNEPITVKEGIQTINLRDQTIQGTEGAGITVNAGAELNLVLEGENSVTGAPGFAGIYVAPDAKLTISGEGSLTATGGSGYSNNRNNETPKAGYWYYGGGAGIGGNGTAFVTNIDPNETKGSTYFGTIIINGGTITAIGGNDSGNVGAGAGIGGGGGGKDDRDAEGTIQITNGEITATGGESCGGAGIGSGGGKGNYFHPRENSISIEISGGTITATGGDCGAGIGGGSNHDSGKISISSGDITAKGNGDTYFGGAGIGGGDNGNGGGITISGDAVVDATGGGGAAGIGGGHGDGANPYDSGSSGDITIEGEAKVTARADANSTSAGAGIGSGGNAQHGHGSITVGGTASVQASGGRNAESIGSGAGNGPSPEGSDVTISPEANIFEVCPVSEEDDGFYATVPNIEDVVDEAGMCSLYTVLEVGAMKSDKERATIPLAVSVLKKDAEGTETLTSSSKNAQIKITIPSYFNLKAGSKVTVKKDESTISLMADGEYEATVGNNSITFEAPLGKYIITVPLTHSDAVTATSASIELEEVESTSTSTSYAINLVADTDLLYVNAAEMVVEYTGNGSSYEIVGDNDFEVVKDINFSDTNQRYAFHLPDDSTVWLKVGKKITIGKIICTGYTNLTEEGTSGYAAISIKNAAAHSETYEDSLVTDIKVEPYKNDSFYTKTPAVTETKINVVFPNTVDSRSEAYTDMTVSLHSALDDLHPIDNIKLGNDNGDITYTDNTDGYAQYTATADIIANTRYTATFTGAGYRTYSIDFVIPDDASEPTVTVWNNVMDEPDQHAVVSYMTADGEKTITTETGVTFLAGEIVKDNNINLYDLSAVVAYFGRDNKTETGNNDLSNASNYAQYDLNRDGAIDSKDIAMVLVSWGY